MGLRDEAIAVAQLERALVAGRDGQRALERRRRAERDGDARGAEALGEQPAGVAAVAGVGRPAEAAGDHDRVFD